MLNVENITIIRQINHPNRQKKYVQVKKVETVNDFDLFNYLFRCRLQHFNIFQ